jgi:hypothetical protein
VSRVLARFLAVTELPVALSLPVSPGGTCRELSYPAEMRRAVQTAPFPTVPLSLRPFGDGWRRCQSARLRFRAAV